MDVHIETQRLLLRDVRKADVQGFFELDSDPEVHTYLGNNPVKHIEESEKTIQHILQHYVQNGLGRLAVIEKATGAFMGWSGLKYETVIRPESPYYDLGYRLKKAYWGQGVATEAAIASLEYGFQTLGLKEICAAASIRNIASNKVLQKVGLEWMETFEYEGEVCNWYRMANPKRL